MNTLKKILTIGALGVASAIAGLGCASTKHDFKSLDLYLENNSYGQSLRTQQERMEISKDGKKAFVAEYTDGNEFNATARQYLPAVNGYVSLIEDSKSVKHANDQNAFGADFKAKTNDGIVFAGSLERTLDKDLAEFNFGVEKSDLSAKMGIAQLSDQNIMQGIVVKSFGDNEGYLFGVGGLYGDKEQLTLNVRKFTKKGEGFGYDIWFKGDKEGNSTTKAVVGLAGSKLTKFLGVQDFEGNGLNELKLINNPLERLSPDFTKAATTIVAKHVTKKGADDVNSLTLYQDMGSLGIIKDINLGLSTSFDNDVKPSVSFNLGPVGIYYENGLSEGNAPNHYISAWVSASDIYKFFGGK